VTRIDPPDWRAIVRARFSGEAFRPEAAEELVEELAQHLESAYQDLRARGKTSEDARAELRRQLEAPELMEGVRSRLRSGTTPTPGIDSTQGRQWLPAMVAFDLRYAVRALRRAPILSAVIVLSLSVVIGANTAIFGLIDALVLRRLPIPDAHELVAIHTSNKGEPHGFEYRQLQLVRDAAEMPALQAFRAEPAAIRTARDSADLWVDMVTGGYFNLLRISPLLGRTFTENDESSLAPVVIISEDFWDTYFDRDSSVVGKPLTVGMVSATIVGVLPRAFAGIHFARRMQLAMPIGLSPGGFTDPASLQVTMLARRSVSDANFARLNATIGNCCIDPRKFGFTPPARGNRPPAQPAESAPSAQWRAFSQADSTAHISVADISRGLPWDSDYRGRYSRMLFALAAGGAILLVIACVNVAALMVSRAAARSRDFAIRLAMGASRRRVATQLFTETLLLATAGAALGILVAQAANRLLLHNLPPVAARLSDALVWRPSTMVFLFTAGIVVLSTTLVGLWPARDAARADVITPLTGGRKRTSSRWPVGATLVSVQVACTIVLVVLGTLFAATVRELTRTEGGYGTRNVLLARLGTASFEDSTSALLTRHQELLRDVSTVPGVRGVAFSTSAPVIQDMMAWTSFDLSGNKPVRGKSGRVNIVSPGFFAASGIGMEQGRDFTAADQRNAEPVVIVSASLARRHFPRGAIGAPVGLSHGTARIVGVARDARYDKLAGEPSLRKVDEDIVYFPIAQSRMPLRIFQSMTLIVRTDGDAIDMIPALRSRVSEVAPELNIYLFTTVGQLLDNVTVGERFLAALTNVFAALALLLASAGVFGVMSYQVTQRTREIGVRMALGARPADAVWLVLRRALIVAGIGAAGGTALALAAAHAVRAQLYGVSAANPLVLAFAAAVLVSVAIVAALLPSRRAALVDPLTALRAE
jgi:predicted permease